MKVSVDEATGREWLEGGHKEMLDVRMSVEEAMVLRTILRRFRLNTDIVREWDEELSDAGVPRPDDVHLGVETDSPILFLFTTKEPK